MRFAIGGFGSNGKVVFDDSKGLLRIWQKGWVGKRKYKVKVQDVNAVMNGWYTSRIRLPMQGFNIEFNNGGQLVIVTVQGSHRRFIKNAEDLAHAIGKSSGLNQFEVDGATVFYGRSNPETGAVHSSSTPSSVEHDLTNTEKVIAGAARGVKNIAGEVTSDVKNVASNFKKGVAKFIAGIVVLSIFAANQILGLFVLVVIIWFYRKNR